MNENLMHESDRRKNLLFQKVGIFIDAENIELSSLKHHDGRTDYKKLIEKVGDREILRILYYKPIYKEISQTFQEFWKRLGGEIKQPAKNADSFLIIDAVTMAEKLDVAIIVGGDKDYLPLIWYLKSRGCRVEIWSWPESTSPEVREAADVYFPLTKDFVIDSEVPKEAGSSRGRLPEASSDRPAPARPEARPDAPPKAPPKARSQEARSESRGAKPAAAARGSGSSPKSRAVPAEPPAEVETELATEDEDGETAAPKRRGSRRRGRRGGVKRRGRGGSGGTQAPPSDPAP